MPIVHVPFNKETAAAAMSLIDWEPGPTLLNRQCVMIGAYGDKGSGKTTFAFSAARPGINIAYLHDSENLYGRIQVASKICNVMQHDFGGLYFGTTDQVKVQAKAREEKFIEFYTNAYAFADVIILDTETGYRELLNYATFGSFKSEGLQFEYNAVNLRWKKILSIWVEQMNLYNRTTLIILAKTSDVYEPTGLTKDGKPGKYQKTGKTQYKGHSSTADRCEVRVRTHRLNDSTWQSKIIHPWYNASTTGDVLVNQASNFGQVMRGQTGNDGWITGEWG